MKRAIFTFTLILSLFLVISPRVGAQMNSDELAQWNCNVEPQHKGAAGLAYTTNEWPDDCSICIEGSPCWLDWLNRAVVKSTDYPLTLTPRLIGDPDYTHLIPREDNNGEVRELHTDTNSNWAFKSEDWIQHPELLQIAPALTYHQTARPAFYDAECFYQNKDPAECFKDIPGASLDLKSDEPRRDYLSTSTPLQRMLSPDAIVKLKNAEAKIHKDCLADPLSHLDCNAKTEVQPGKYSDTLADKAIAVEDYQDLLALSPDKRAEAVAYERTNMSCTFYIVAVPILENPDNVFRGILASFYYIFWQPEKAVFFRGNLDGCKPAAQWEKTYQNLLNPPDKNLLQARLNHAVFAAQEVTSPNATTQSQSPATSGQVLGSRPGGIVHPKVIAATKNPNHKKLLEKINASGARCLPYLPPEQFLGSLSHTRPRLINGLSAWLFDILGNLEENIPPQPYKYRYCLVEAAEPTEIDAAVTTSLKGSARAFYNPRYTKDPKLNQDMANPQPMSGGAHAQTDPVTYNICEACQSNGQYTHKEGNQCCRTETIYIEYDNNGLDVPVGGAHAAHDFKLQVDKQVILSPKDEDRFICGNYRPQAEDHAKAVGVNLSSIVGAANLAAFDPHQTPACISAPTSDSTTPPIAGDYACPISVEQMRSSGMSILPNPPPHPPNDYLQFYNWLDQTFPTNTHTNTGQMPDPTSVGCLINYAQAFWPGSKFTASNIKQVISWAQSHGWNPSLLLAIWLEESHAGAASNKEFGCGDEQTPGGGYEQQLSCLETVSLSGNFSRFMCAFAGDCPDNETQDTNPNFPAVIQFFNILTQTSVWNKNST